MGKSIEDTLANINAKVAGAPEGGAPEVNRQSPNFEEYKALFHKSFIQCNEELDYTNFDVNLSGSTVCTVIFNGTKVFCANAGDSRAIKVAFNNHHDAGAGGSLTRKTGSKFLLNNILIFNLCPVRFYRSHP